MENETNQKNKGQIILIIILFLIIIGLAGYVVYDKAFKNDKTKEPVQVEKKDNETKELNNDEAKKLVKKYIIDGMGLSHNYPLDLEREEDITYVVVANAKKEPITCKEALKIEGIKKYLEKDDCESRDDLNYITYDNFNTVYKSLFKTDKDIPKENRLHGIGGTYYYDKVGNRFVTVTFNGGGILVGSYKEFLGIKEITTDGNKVYITAVYDNLHSVVDNGIYTKETIDKTLTYKTEENEEEFIKNNIDKLTQYKFEFEKNGNNYLLVNLDRLTCINAEALKEPSKLTSNEKNEIINFIETTIKEKIDVSTLKIEIEDDNRYNVTYDLKLKQGAYSDNCAYIYKISGKWYGYGFGTGFDLESLDEYFNQFCK